MAPAFARRLLQVAFELTIGYLGDPVLIITSVFASGTAEILQFNGCSHAVLTDPVQIAGAGMFLTMVKWLLVCIGGL